PEGNGVELYWDRPRETWQWHNDRVAMATHHLDPDTFLRGHLTEESLRESAAHRAAVGHVHLKVGDIPTARACYVNTVGFEVTSDYGTQALFVSAGKYHHHMAMKTWASRGALDRSPALGLGEVGITVPDLDDIGALREWLSARGIPTFD